MLEKIFGPLKTILFRYNALGSAPSSSLTVILNCPTSRDSPRSYSRPGRPLLKSWHL
jgi:hypothetical protein